MNPEACHMCGGALETRHPEHREQIGRHVTVDHGVPWLVCATCGEASISDAAWKAAELRAALTVLHDLPHVEGAVLRAVRKILGLTQKQLGAILELDHATISRSEASAAHIPRTTQLALATLVERAQRGERLEVPAEPVEGAVLRVAS